MRWPWQRKNAELDRELAHHLNALIDSYRKQGLPEAEAIRLAKIDFGGVEGVKEECRELRWWAWLSHMQRDVIFGVRMLRKAPALSGAALLSLALGIGATTAILSLADAVLWRSLAIPAPEQFHEVLWESNARVNLVRSSSGSMYPDGALRVADFFSVAAFEGMSEGAAGKAELAGHIGVSTVSANYRGAVVVAKLLPVTGRFFSVLQIQPVMGRLLAAHDDDATANPVVVVTHRFWQRSLGAEEDVVGKTIRINNTLYEIAGVLPASFFGIMAGDPTEIYAPLHQSPVWLQPESWIREESNNPTSWWMRVVARRAPDVSVAELRSLLDSAFAASWAAKPESPEATPRIRLSDAQHGLGGIRRQYGNPVLILFGLVALVLTVACANIANLLLARAVSREKEVALRVSLGCGEARLVRQLFTESILLAIAGGALSLPVAWGLTQLMLNFMPDGFEHMLAASGLDFRLLAATAAVTGLAAMLFGLYPAFRGARVNAAPALKEEAGSGNTMSRARWAPAKALVLLQVALGVLLITAAILYTGQLWEVLHRETGFSEGNMLLMDLRPGEAGYQGERLSQFYVALEERLRALPGVEAVGLSRTRPMLGGGYWDTAKLPGETKEVQTAVHHVNSEFLAALGVKLMSGRAITQQELRSGAKVAVISEALAKGLGLQSPLGAQVRWSDVDYQVVGVARDARYSRMTQSPAVGYLPIDYERDFATVLIRSSIPPFEALRLARNAIREMDRTLPMVDVYTMEQQISKTLQHERLFAWLCGSFGVLALVLCVVGLYGLFSYTTARRTPEIGIRIAVGASRKNVVTQVLGEGMRLALAGLAAGIPLALYCAWIAKGQKLLPEGAFPYWALLASMGVLAISATLAVLLPALRASTVDPMRALRRG